MQALTDAVAGADLSAVIAAAETLQQALQVDSPPGPGPDAVPALVTALAWVTSANVRRQFAAVDAPDPFQAMTLVCTCLRLVVQRNEANARRVLELGVTDVLLASVQSQGTLLLADAESIKSSYFAGIPVQRESRLLEAWLYNGDLARARQVFFFLRAGVAGWRMFLIGASVCASCRWQEPISPQTQAPPMCWLPCTGILLTKSCKATALSSMSFGGASKLATPAGPPPWLRESWTCCWLPCSGIEPQRGGPPVYPSTHSRR